MINLIIDTDIGDDPDDILVLYLILLHPELFNLIALVSGDEVHGNHRAKLLSLILKKFKRNNVPVYVGTDFGSTKFLFDAVEIESENAEKPIRFSTDDIAKMCKDIEGDIYYLCIQGQTNLARIINEQPLLLNKLKVFQMGGAIKFRTPDKAEHNFRIDSKSVVEVLKSEVNIKLILSDTTFQFNKFFINKDSDIYKKLLSKQEDIYGLLIKNLDRFFLNRYPESLMSDVIALLSLLYPKFLKFSNLRFIIDEKAILHLDEHGRNLLVSEKNYDEKFVYQQVFKLLNI